MALRVEKQSVSSLQTALGVRVSRSISSGSGVFIPQAFAAYHHEVDNDSRSIGVRFVNDPAGTAFAIPSEDPDRNFFTLGLGVSGVFARGVSDFLNYETVLGMKDVSNHIISAGLRMEW